MRLLAMLTVAGCALTAAAQDLKLQGDSHLSEPNTASVVNTRQQREEIVAAMQAIRIPEMDFREADLRDVILFLANASREITTNQFQVGFIVKFYDQTLFDSSSTNSEPHTVTDAPKITFSAIDITLKDALDVAVEMANCRYLTCNSTIMIVHNYREEIEIRGYDIPEISINRLEDMASRLKLAEPDISDGTIKALFEHMGVTWPRGSYIKPMPVFGKLIVYNTRENLDAFEKCLATLRLEPYQIEIELAFLACDRQQISDLGPDGITAPALTALWTDGKAELLAAPRVLTQSGQAATVKGMTEYIYPTELEIFRTDGTTNTNIDASIFMINPGQFTSREVGVILEVTPELSPEGNQLNINLSPEFIEAPVWEQFGGTFVDAGGKAHQVNVEQPYFHTYKEYSSILVANGKRVLIGGGIPSRDGQRLIYMLLTARLVGTDGEPLR